jgi:hypothetical protein
MPIRKLLLLVVGLALALAALAPASVLAKAGGTDRPVKGMSSGISRYNPLTMDFSEDNAGVLTHFGRTTGHEEGTLAFTPFPAFAGSGTATLVAANGDEATATWTATGEVKPDLSGHTATIVLTITPGGTGRFADASGTITVIQDGTTLFREGATSVDHEEETLTGDISY